MYVSCEGPLSGYLGLNEYYGRRQSWEKNNLTLQTLKHGQTFGSEVVVTVELLIAMNVLNPRMLQLYILGCSSWWFTEI